MVINVSYSAWRTWPFGELGSEHAKEYRIDTTFIIHHDFRKYWVPVNTNLDRKYIFLNNVAPSWIQFCVKSVGKALSVVVSNAECSFASVKLLSPAGLGVHFQDLSNTILYLSYIQQKIFSVKLHSTTNSRIYLASHQIRIENNFSHVSKTTFLLTMRNERYGSENLNIPPSTTSRLKKNARFTLAKHGL